MLSPHLQSGYIRGIQNALIGNFSQVGTLKHDALLQGNYVPNILNSLS